MLGLLVSNRAPFEPLQAGAPVPPGFVRRALMALFRKR